jgi:hypothetical protein
MHGEVASPGAVSGKSDAAGSARELHLPIAMTPGRSRGVGMTEIDMIIRADRKSGLPNLWADAAKAKRAYASRRGPGRNFRFDFNAH